VVNLIRQPRIPGVDNAPLASEKMWVRLQMGHYIPIQWIKLVTLVETCCSMAWYSIVRQTQLTDIG
jgi:type III secretory pathway component EscU